MNFNKLEAFILVVEKKSFSEAAATLKSSQPTTSLKIKSLEEELGMELLERGTSGIQPTAAGKLVYQAAKEVTQRWRRLEDELHGLQDTLTGTLTIGASTIPGTYLVPGWIKTFRNLYPKVDVTIEIGDSKKILDKLLDHQIDVGIIGLEQESTKLQFRPIATDSLVLITPNGHSMIHSDDPEFKQIKQYDFVLREQGSGTRKVMEDYLSVHECSLSDLHSVVSIGSTEAVIAAVEAGLGISFISKLAALPAAKAGRIQIIEKFEPYLRNFYFTSLTDTVDRPIIKEFTELLFKR
ncbi:LysR family transcriptional regulator [Neobacillus bataviensis LMG 21833]|uniref:LysR family transcriptional regulator n=1 Tax=Neobacillus bataviensis LMG 21833 TaxID=1117379 RepID=K6ECA8_9BACI|nr:selenium metabolism-associated LysR family transcriptional regulator [Neobacillus bataviensis]EKN71061.1 LysR family transcriptional regulator [Neobacillus bataviensis LMG 21833]